MNTNLDLHSSNYIKLNTPIKFFLTEDVTDEQFETIKSTLSEQTTPLAITGKHIKNALKDCWIYYLNEPSFSLTITEHIEPNKKNFQLKNFVSAKDGKNSYYNNPFAAIFLIEAAAGICLIRKGSSIFFKPRSYCNPLEQTKFMAVDEWGMDYKEFDILTRKMIAFFAGDDSQIQTKHVRRAMEANIITPFINYAEKEHNYELNSVDLTEGLSYSKRKVKYRNAKCTAYAFYSNDVKADPEVRTLTIGNRITIYTSEKEVTRLTGTLVDIDDLSDEENIIFVVEFFKQFDDKELPCEGLIFTSQNDTQYKIRRAVYQSIMNGNVPSSFIYRTFNDYSVDGYHLPDEDLAEFLKSKLAGKFPPNQMQFETIVKGILTKDTLLVLGPPGTGKTTVILAWVEYFIKNGIRVLISSQNNAAVDNVLERFKGKGEIVRLGREEKVQENCKEFLPEYKIKTMHEECEKKRKHLKETFEHDFEQIAKYSQLLNDFIAAMEVFLVKKAELQNQCSVIGTSARLIKQTLTLYWETQRKIEELKAKIIKKEIFLEESKKKNFLIRFFLKGYIKKVEQDLTPHKETLIELKESLKRCATQYKQYVFVLTNYAMKFRNSDVYKQYCEALDKINTLNSALTANPDSENCVVPNLVSILSSMYTAPTYSSDPTENLEICRAEIERMKELDNSAKKIEFASSEWARAALNPERNDIFEEILIDVCQVVGATCIGINSNKKFAKVDFGVTIIDESGQIQIHNAIVPMSRSPKTLMLGDYKQIPPIANTDILESCKRDNVPTELYSQSFFEFLFENMRKKEIAHLTSHSQIHQKDNMNAVAINDFEDVYQEGTDDKSGVMTEAEARSALLAPVLPDYSAKPKKKDEPLVSPYSTEEITEMVYKIISNHKKIVNLNSQFRMPGNISDIISEWFYESNYYSGYDMSRFSPIIPGTSEPIVLINTANHCQRKESQPANKMGYQNDYEAKIIAGIIRSVLISKDEESRQEFIDSFDQNLGIISAYGAQVRNIRKYLQNIPGIKLTNEQIQAAVASLDSFQGQERDLIIYSLTRSSDHIKPQKARIGFLKELRRLNVAFTRAKKQLIIIGDIDYLKECLYVKQDDITDESDPLPCANTDDRVITPEIIEQCASCPKECERRFSRFLKLLAEHVSGENGRKATGQTLDPEEFINKLKGE